MYRNTPRSVLMSLQLNTFDPASALKSGQGKHLGQEASSDVTDIHMRVHTEHGRQRQERGPQVQRKPGLLGKLQADPDYRHIINTLQPRNDFLRYNILAAPLKSAFSYSPQKRQVQRSPSALTVDNVFPCGRSCWLYIIQFLYVLLTSQVPKYTLPHSSAKSLQWDVGWKRWWTFLVCFFFFNFKQNAFYSLPCPLQSRSLDRFLQKTESSFLKRQSGFLGYF